MSVMSGAFSRRYSSLSQELPDWSRYLPFTELMGPGASVVVYGELRPQLLTYTDDQRRATVQA